MKHLFHTINVFVMVWLAHFVVQTTSGVVAVGVCGILVVTLIEFVDIIVHDKKE